MSTGEPTLLGALLRGFVARAAGPIAERAPFDPDRLGIPRQRLDPRLRRAVLMRDDLTCVWCFTSARRNHGLHLEIDHIVPWSAGGADHPINLRTLCQPCNQSRSNRVHDLDVRALPIVWRCADCETGDVGKARLIDAYCLVCREATDGVYVADLMVGGPVPTVGVVSAAVDPVPPAIESIWCAARHPFSDLALCRRVRHSRAVLHSPTDTGLADWADEPPTPTDQENRNG